MYRIMLDGSLFWDPRIEELRIINPQLELEVSKAGSLSFSVTPDHPKYNDLHKLKSIIEVYQDNELLFRGRPLDDEKDLWNIKSVICEGELAFLNDSIVRPYIFNGTITDFLTMVLTAHNAQVDTTKRFTLGTVTVTDPNDYIVRSNINPSGSWSEISDKLLNLLGGFLTVRRVSGVSYIDYLIDSPYVSGQTVELTKNILDINQSTKSTDMITALIPYGAKLTNEEGQATEDRLTIASENGGIDYVYNQDAVDQFGWIFGTKTWDDVNVPLNLLSKANQELALRITLGVSITIKAVDLSVINPGIDKIKNFSYVRVISPQHDIDTLAIVTKQSLSLMAPENNTLTFGFDFQTMTEKQVSNDKIIKTIISDYALNETVRAVENSVKEVSSEISQTAENIRLEVAENYVSGTELDGYKSEVATTFTQTKDAFNFDFETLTTIIETLDGQTTTKFTDIAKYIRFIAGDIVLGEAGNEITLKISNNRISFLQSGAEVAYFANNKLFVMDGHFINSMRVGNFSFRPRTNGSLSFGKVT